jgi:hypothetical protein
MQRITRYFFNPKKTLLNILAYISVFQRALVNATINVLSSSHKNNIYKHFQQHHGRKGNSDDVETISDVMNELKQYIKKTENVHSS